MGKNPAGRVHFHGALRPGADDADRHHKYAVALGLRSSLTNVRCFPVIVRVAAALVCVDEVDSLPDADLDGRLQTATVFSRVSPAAKLRLVSAYQRRGEGVAMIGDGVNDAAALKRAGVGVTMGRRGTDVARATATIVLTDDRFETIGGAIAEGRLVFENIRRFVFYLFSCTLAEILVLLGTSAAGLPLPLAPIQVLWLNLQLLHLGNARDDEPVLSCGRVVANRAALGALAVGALSMFAAVQIPAMGAFLHLVPLDGADWALVSGLALVPAVVGQALKASRRWRRFTGAAA